MANEPLAVGRLSSAKNRSGSTAKRSLSRAVATLDVALIRPIGHRFSLDLGSVKLVEELVYVVMHLLQIYDWG